MKPWSSFFPLNVDGNACLWERAMTHDEMMLWINFKNFLFVDNNDNESDDVEIKEQAERTNKGMLWESDKN